MSAEKALNILGYSFEENFLKWNKMKCEYHFSTLKGNNFPVQSH